MILLMYYASSNILLINIVPNFLQTDSSVFLSPNITVAITVAIIKI